ncbi:unnamed protein product (macronuclear) [Paramecium tetraurelia]|uniref:CFA20 domain-containing protein n=1 Tax=Paramecium tetraurelia TaxID=5888 RepID=A0DU76_PARTE|nr:uncharacterized protein GSPATT00020265001 [Paramecium tetraurelia]CAK86593.1 unnamed protein product [Paramecium tetraurelia]|eukprot:XP_001453990.1 hypothetical protein (macronuclear) [Paramecium tetraurelia strain d4-2]
MQRQPINNYEELKQQQPDNTIYDKTMKSFVLKVGPTNPYTYVNSQELNIKGSNLYVQIYVIEKLKFILELSFKDESYKIIVGPNFQQTYSKNKNEVKISSVFILTKKWISLGFDVDSFFKVGEMQVKMLSIQSLGRLKRIYESNIFSKINDGQCLIQKICEKRILELLPMSIRAQSEKLEIRKQQLTNQQRRLSTISNSQERNIESQSDKKSFQSKQININIQQQIKLNNPNALKFKSSSYTQNQRKTFQLQQTKNLSINKIQFSAKPISQEYYATTTNPNQDQQQSISQQQQQSSLSNYNRSKQLPSTDATLIKQLSQECLLEKKIQQTTGLKIIEEVNSTKPPIPSICSSTKQSTQLQLQKKPVQSFLRHNQEFQNGSNCINDPYDEAKIENDQKHKQSQISSGVQDLYYECENSEYQTKYGKFSNTFTRPLGLSSYNHRLVSQQSTNQNQGSTNEYFYLSSQQIEQNQSINQTANEIEEQIEAPELKSKMTEESFNSINGLQIKQEDSQEELAVSKFE